MAADTCDKIILQISGSCRVVYLSLQQSCLQIIGVILSAVNKSISSTLGFPICAIYVIIISYLMQNFTIQNFTSRFNFF